MKQENRYNANPVGVAWYATRIPAKPYKINVGVGVTDDPYTSEAITNTRRGTGYRTRNNHGITLTALAVTIVIMIILTSVGINITSTTHQAMELQQFKTKLEIMQTEAIEKYGEAGTSAYVQDNLKLQLDGIENTGSGHNNSTDTWYDLSGNGIDGAINGATWNEEGNGLVLDGNDDGVFLGDGLIDMYNNDFTFEIVAYYDKDNVRDIILGNYTLLAENSFENNIERGSSSGDNFSNKIRFFFNRGVINYITINDIFNNEDSIILTECIFNKNESFVSYYKNGEFIESSGKNSKFSATGEYKNVWLGRDSRTNFTAMAGTIYAARIYDRALTDEEVEKNYYLDQIRFNIGADEEGYVHYTPEQLAKLGFTYTDQDAYINWETREVKMYYNGEEYYSQKNTTKTNIDTAANTNFDMNIVYEDGRYKVKVVPEENKAGLRVAYRKASSNTWLHADGYKFEYAEYGTTEVKLYDNNGNETIKTIKELDYLESNGRNYIDIGYYANSKTKIETQFLISAEHNSSIFGARQNLNQDNMLSYMLVDAASLNKYLYSYYGSYLNNSVNDFETGKIYTATMEKGICVIDDLDTIGLERNQEFSMDIPMYLFAFNEGGNSAYRQAGTRIYYFKVYEDDNLVMDLVPMGIIDSNGEMQSYMFDKISDKLLSFENV